MIPELRLVSEEIVRWAFEVKIHAGADWKIAFTNPTAGPWKRVMGVETSGTTGEVHRFEIDEKRPDLIIYSDRFKTVVIIEAKTDLPGLANNSQTQKTVELFLRLERLLKSKESNSFWSQRVGYRYVLGLLWGSKQELTTEITAMVQGYLKELDGQRQDVLCIEGELNENRLDHRLYWGKSGMLTSLESFFEPTSDLE